MRSFLAFCISLFLVLPGRAQERIRHVQLRVIDSSQLEIRYDLVTIRPGDSIYIGVRSRSRGVLNILPEFVRGDVGKYVTSGLDRRIVWAALANGYSLNEEIRATVLIKAGLPITLGQPVKSAPIATPPSVVKPSTPEPAVANEPKRATPAAAAPERSNEPITQPAEIKPGTSSTSEEHPGTRYAGPAWALVSAVVPGIGNIFVQTPKPKVGIRPLLTVGCYGLLVYGLGERKKSQDEYAIYLEQKNMAAGEPFYQTANMHHQRYFMATRGAIVLAAADVILTFIRGIRNSKVQRKTQSVTLQPGLQAGQLTAVARYTF